MLVVGVVSIPFFVRMSLTKIIIIIIITLIIIIKKTGEGGCGIVYKGRLKGVGDVAIKEITVFSAQSLEEFALFSHETFILSRLKHAVWPNHYCFFGGGGGFEKGFCYLLFFGLLTFFSFCFSQNIVRFQGVTLNPLSIVMEFLNGEDLQVSIFYDILCFYYHHHYQ